MKKIFALAAGTAVILGGTTLIAPAAQADTPGCVTRAEYRSVQKGMPKAKVHGIFDIDGRRISIATSGGYASEVRTYRTCSPYSTVAISWSKRPGGVWKLAAKSAVWVG